MVYVFLTQGFELVEAMTPVDLLRRAGVEVATVSITDDLTVRSSSQVCVCADLMLEQCDFDSAQVLLLPGGPGTQGYLNCEPLLDALVRHHQAEKWIAAICAAPGVLAKIGIHVKSTIYPTLKDQIRDYTDKAICVDGNVITANGVGAALDFALVIIAYLKGVEEAKTVGRAVVYSSDED